MAGVGFSALTPPQADFDARRDFASILGGIASPGRGRPGVDEARDAAEKLVATVLVEPILKQVRENNNAAPPFQPTHGERQFRSMLDAKLAQEITRSARFPLVERLARDVRQQLRTEAQHTFTARA